MIKPAVLDAMVAAGCTAEQIAAAVKADQAERSLHKKARKSAWETLRREVFQRDGYVCVYCGADVSDQPQCDHVIPVLLGGETVSSNLATACRVCNSSKSGKSLAEWKRQ